MISKIKTISVNPYVWLITSWIVLLLPLLLLGSPGFYNDDFNSYQAIEQLGLFGSIQNWLTEYGSGYRPVGISLLYSYYSVMPENSFLLYFGYQLLYIALSFVLFREVYIFTKNASASVFVALFFLFFPFNATVFWQISSLMMVVATIFSVVLMRQIVSLSNRVFLLSIVGWVLLLFTYEQLLGLAAVIGLLIAVVHYEENPYHVFRKSIIPLVIIGAVSAIFLAVYFSSDVNPKIITLKSFNTEYTVDQEIGNVAVEHQLDTLTPSKEVSGDSQTDLSNSGRLDHFMARFETATSFLMSSISFSVQSILFSGIAGYTMISAILVLGIMAFFVPLSYPILTKSTSLLYILIGALWVSGTLAPFFLYNEVHIPPYTLMLPSIGLGIAIFGMFQLIMPLFSVVVATVIVRTALIMAVMIFPLIQYGYYFGLEEELRYWENIASEIHQGNVEIVEDTMILSEANGKKNSHIFWLENAVGLRYISELLGSDINITSISHSFGRVTLITSQGD